MDQIFEQISLVVLAIKLLGEPGKQSSWLSQVLLLLIDFRHAICFCHGFFAQLIRRALIYMEHSIFQCNSKWTCQIILKQTAVFKCCTLDASMDCFTSFLQRKLLNWWLCNWVTNWLLYQLKSWLGEKFTDWQTNFRANFLGSELAHRWFMCPVDCCTQKGSWTSIDPPSQANTGIPTIPWVHSSNKPSRDEGQCCSRRLPHW